MKKRIFAILLSLCMVIGLLPVTALAEEIDYSSGTAIATAKTTYSQTDNTNFWYVGANQSADAVYAYLTQNNLDNAGPTYTLTICGAGNAKDWAQPRTTSWHADFQNKITKAEVKSGVSYIGNYTIFDLPNCSEVVLEDGLSAIGTSSISRLAITEITLPDSLTTIGRNAFYNDTQLSTIHWGKGLTTIYGGAFGNCGFTTISLPSTLKTISSLSEAGAEPIFPGCDLRGTLVIPEGVETINGPLLGAGGWTSQPYNPNIDTVSLPNSLKTLSGSAVANSGIKTITIPENISEIPNSFAYNCPYLETAFIQSTADEVTIGASAFGSCPVLKAVVVSGSVKLETNGGYGTGTSVLYCKSFSGSTNSSVPIAVTSGGTFAQNTSFTAGSLATPTKEGYTFGGWYTDESLNTPISGNAPAVNRTYYAKWDEKTYTVTWDVDGETTTEKYTYGAEITLPTAPTKNGYRFTGWSGYSDGMTMPAGDVTFTAQWKKIHSGGGSSSDSSSEKTYAVSTEKSKNGSVKLSDTKAVKGDTVTITVKPEDGYVLDTLTVTDADGDEVKLKDKGDGKFTFTMPASKITVEATFVLATEVEQPTQPTAHPFADIAAGSWIDTAVQYVYANGLMAGVSETEFAPSAATSRAMIWTILARRSGADTTGGANWYEKGQQWAIANGISDGSNPSGSITREQLAAMLWRTVGCPLGAGDLSAFTDANTISDYAVTAMQWAIETGLMTGNGSGTLAPKAGATRAETAAMLMRFCEANQ